MANTPPSEILHSDPFPSWLRLASDGTWHLAVKAVPGSSRDRIVGPLGDRLKIQVSLPPEGGKANKAIINLLATWWGVANSQVEIISGASNPQKVFRLPPRADLPDLH